MVVFEPAGMAAANDGATTKDTLPYPDMVWIPGGTFAMGSGQALPGGTSGAPLHPSGPMRARSEMEEFVAQAARTARLLVEARAVLVVT